MAKSRGDQSDPRTGRRNAPSQKLSQKLSRPTRVPDWDEGLSSDSAEDKPPPKRGEKRSRDQDSRDRPDALSKVPVKQAEIRQAIERLVHDKLGLFAQICEAMRYIQDHHPDVLNEVTKRVRISDDALGLIAHGPQSETTFVEHEVLPSRPSLKSKGVWGLPASQPPSPDPHSVGASPAETDWTPRAQPARASTHRAAPDEVAAPTSNSQETTSSLLTPNPSPGSPGAGAPTKAPLQSAYGGQQAFPPIGGSQGGTKGNVAPGQSGAPAALVAQAATTLAPAPPGHAPSVPLAPSQLTQSSAWGIDLGQNRTNGPQTWYPGQYYASGPGMHVGAQPGGPPAAMVHGAPAPPPAPTAAGPVPSQPPHGNIVSVQPNGGLPVNLMWSNPAAYQLLLAAQASSAPVSQHHSGSGSSAVAALPRPGVSSLDGLQSHPSQASLPPHLANMISYAQPGPFHMSAHPPAGGEPQGPWVTGVTQQALDGTLLDPGDTTNYANMSLL